MKIFFCGPLIAQWMTSWQRAQTFRELGHTVIEFAQDDYYDKPSLSITIVKHITKHYLFNPKKIEQFNKNFILAIQEAKPEIAWIEKALLLLPETLEKAKRILPGCTFVCFQEDDPFGLSVAELPVWKNFIDAIPFYDIHFVWREFNVKEFTDRGAQRVCLYMPGFYPGIFHPMPRRRCVSEYKHDVVFVGYARSQRIQDIYSLIFKHQIPVKVYGSGWYKTPVFFLKSSLFHPPVLAQDYVSTIWHSKISLGFLSVENRDEFTLRTFEIPACKGFFLAQRSTKHLEIYEEGKEAEFFGSDEECADKINFYLKNESERIKIAEAGYQRCIKSGYSLHERLSRALKEVMVV
ncbi:MAG: glycosyltransferase [Crinalium sp.]